MRLKPVQLLIMTFLLLTMAQTGARFRAYARFDAPVQSILAGESRGSTQIGAAGIQRTSAAIMASQALADQQPQPVRIAKPRFQLDRQRLAENPNAPAVTQWPTQADTSPVGASNATALSSLSTTFTGATLADTNRIPPGTMGTVGPGQFVVAINGRLRTFNKATGVADGVIDSTLETFFSSVMTPPIANNITNDPRIRYDRMTSAGF